MTTCTQGVCPHYSSIKRSVITLEKEVVAIIQGLLDKFPEHEWGAFLIGKETSEGYAISSLNIPKQKVTPTFVDLENEDYPKDSVGWIHSHNKMSTHLSTTDESTALIHKVSLVVNNKMEFSGVVKHTLPCGTKTLLPIESVILMRDTLEVDTSMIEIQKAKPPTYLPNIAPGCCAVCGGVILKGQKTKACDMCGRMLHKHCYKKSGGSCNECRIEYTDVDDDLWMDNRDDDWWEKQKMVWAYP
jgi:proteasome lid subunit RPN8/RPN11